MPPRVNARVRWLEQYTWGVPPGLVGPYEPGPFIVSKIHRDSDGRTVRAEYARGPGKARSRLDRKGRDSFRRFLRLDGADDGLVRTFIRTFGVIGFDVDGL